MMVATAVFAASRLSSAAGSARKLGWSKSDCLILGDNPTTVAPAESKAFVTWMPRPPLAPVIRAIFPVIEALFQSGDHIRFRQNPLIDVSVGVAIAGKMRRTHLLNAAAGSRPKGFPGFHFA